MNPGKLRHRVNIQRPVDSKNAIGEVVSTWETVASVWASIEPLSARELFNLSVTYATATHKVTIRHIEDVTAKYRVVFGSRIFNIESVVNPEERNEQLSLTCSEIQ